MEFCRDTLAANLRAERARNRKPQEEVAKVVGLDPMTIANYENGKFAPSYETAWKLADYYGVTLDALGGRDL